MVDWKQEARKVGELFIAEMDEPDRYDVGFSTDGRRRFLSIYDKRECWTLLTLGATTYRELYLAVQFAWDIHTMADRGH